MVCSALLQVQAQQILVVTSSSLPRSASRRVLVFSSSCHKLKQESKSEAKKTEALTNFETLGEDALTFIKITPPVFFGLPISFPVTHEYDEQAILGKLCEHQ